MENEIDESKQVDVVVRFRGKYSQSVAHVYLQFTIHTIHERNVQYLQFISSSFSFFVIIDNSIISRCSMLDANVLVGSYKIQNHTNVETHLVDVFTELRSGICVW